MALKFDPEIEYCDICGGEIVDGYCETCDKDGEQEFKNRFYRKKKLVDKEVVRVVEKP